MEVGLVVLDKAFHPTASTVDLLIQESRRSVPDAGDHKTWVGLSFYDLSLVDDLARAAPAPGLIIEGGEKPHRFPCLLSLGSSLRHQGFAEGLELLVNRLSQNEINLVCVTQIVDLRSTEVRVPPQGDLHLRPRL